MRGTIDDKEFSLYEEEEKIISKANEFISLGGNDNLELS